MSQGKILLVEDDQFLRELYLEALTSEGYTVDTASEGEEGLEKVKTDGYDLVLLDIILPKIDGLEIMRQVKSITPPQVNKCVVFLTNLDKDEEIKEALKLGDGYLIKSQLTPGDLIREVYVYMEKVKAAASSTTSQ